MVCTSATNWDNDICVAWEGVPNKVGIIWLREDLGFAHQVESAKLSKDE